MTTAAGARGGRYSAGDSSTGGPRDHQAEACVCSAWQHVPSAPRGAAFRAGVAAGVGRAGFVATVSGGGGGVPDGGDGPGQGGGLVALDHGDLVGVLGPGGLR